MNITDLLDKSLNQPKKLTVLQPLVTNISSNSEIKVSPFVCNHGCVSENGKAVVTNSSSSSEEDQQISTKKRKDLALIKLGYKK